MPEYSDLQFRWLGVAGVELTCRERTLLLDPFLSRPPFWSLVFGKPFPCASVLDRHILRANAILVTHAHYDHMMDVPYLSRKFSTPIYGSPNVMAIAKLHEIPENDLHLIKPNDRFSVAGYSVEVLAGRHGPILGVIPFGGKIRERLQPPLALREYRMDEMYSFRIVVDGRSFLFWNSPEVEGASAADVLLHIPYWREERIRKLLEAVRPKICIPIHWDDFFRPLDKPIRPLTLPPGWGDPRIRRLNMSNYKHRVESFLPGCLVQIPDLLEPCTLSF